MMDGWTDEDGWIDGQRVNVECWKAANSIFGSDMFTVRKKIGLIHIMEGKLTTKLSWFLSSGLEFF